MKTLHQLAAQFNHRFTFTPHHGLGGGVKIVDTVKMESMVITGAPGEDLLSKVEGACGEQIKRGNNGLKLPKLTI